MHLAFAIVATVAALIWSLFVVFASAMDPEGRSMDDGAQGLALWPWVVPALLYAAWYWNWWAY